MQSKVLVVGQKQESLAGVKEALVKNGFTVLTSESAEDGLEIINNKEIHLVAALDNIPDGPWHEFLGRVKESSPHTMTMLICDDYNPDLIMKAFEAGELHTFFRNPCDELALTVAMQRALEQSELMKEHEQLLDISYEENFKLVNTNNSLEEKMAELRKAQAELEASFFASVKSFLNLLELKDPWLGGHSKRVAALAKGIASRVSYPEKELLDLECAALLHDVGLFGVPNSLLQKPEGALSASELALIQQHPALGQAALMDSSRMKEACLLIRCHHEYFGGGGYPDGLSGEEVPLGARIIGLVEDFDTLLYGLERRQVVDSVLDQMRKQKKRYDPDIWLAFLEVTNRKEAAHGERLVTVSRLKEGDILARDLRTGKKVLLAPRGTTLTPLVIAKIQNFHNVDPIIEEVFIIQK